MAVSIRQLQRKTLALINNVGENVNHPRFPLSVRGALEGLHRSVDAFVSGDVTVVSDHGALTGLGDDDHTQYALLAGRPGGQILMGGFATDALDLRSNSLNNSTTARVLINSTPNIIFDLPSGTVDPLALTLGLVSGTMLGTSLTFTLNATGGNSSTIRINNTSGSTTARQLRIDKVSGQTGAMTSWHGESPTFTEMSYISASDGSFNGPISPTFTTSFDPPDDIFHIVGSGDPNKKLRWEVDGLSVATRILTPQDANYIMAGTNIAQTFTKGQTIDNDTASDVLLTMKAHASQTGDVYKALRDGGAVMDGLINFAGTGIYLHQFGAGAASDVVPLIYLSDFSALSGPTYCWGLLFNGTQGVYLALDANPTATTTMTFPKAGGTVMTLGGSGIVVGSYEFGTTTVLRTGVPAFGSGTRFRDATTSTKQLFVELASATGDNVLSVVSTAARTYTLPDASITISGSAAALTSGRVPFATTGGILTDDADLTFATDTLTATKVSAPTHVTSPLHKLESAAAPVSPAEGDLWNDSTQETLVGFTSGIKQHLAGCIFSKTDTTTVTNTVTETSLMGSGVGTITLPANFFAVGKTVRLRAWGIYSSDAVNYGGLLRIRYGGVAGTVLATSGSGAAYSAASEYEWFTTLDITCRSVGGTGTVFSQGYHIETNGPIATPGYYTYKNTTTVTIDTTAASDLVLTMDWTTADTDNSFSCTNLTLEVLA